MEQDFLYKNLTMKYYDSVSFSKPNDPNNVVLILGGIAQNIRALLPFAKAIGSDMRVILVDPPGMGRSDPLSLDLDHRYIAEVISAFLDTLHIARVSVFASSFSCQIAYAFASLYPGKCVKMILGGPLLATDKVPSLSWVKEVKSAATIENKKEIIHKLFNILIDTAGDRATKNKDFTNRIMLDHMAYLSESDVNKIYDNLIRSFKFDDLFHDLIMPKHKALLFTGEYDNITTPSYCKDALKNFAQASLVLIKDADHLVPMQQNALMLQLVSKYLLTGEVLESSDILINKSY